MKPKNTAWIPYLKTSLGKHASRLGEQLGINWLIYNPLHFEHFHREALANCRGVVVTLARQFPNAMRWADIGAGSGVYAAEAARLGKQVVACEHNSYGRKRAAQQGVDIRPFDLFKQPPSDLQPGFDLAYCFEVAEHLPPELGDKLVEFLCGLAAVVVFTAAQPGQGGTAHINEQPPNYWIARFEARGMTFDREATIAVKAGFVSEKVPAPWFHNNVVILKRQATGG